MDVKIMDDFGIAENPDMAIGNFSPITEYRRQRLRYMTCSVVVLVVCVCILGISVAWIYRPAVSKQQQEETVTSADGQRSPCEYSSDIVKDGIMPVCPVISVSGALHRTTWHGVYAITSMDCGQHPVYQKYQEKQYVFSLNHSKWLIGSGVCSDGAWMYNPGADRDPGRLSGTWKEYYDDSWHLNSNITVTCQEPCPLGFQYIAETSGCYLIQDHLLLNWTDAADFCRTKRANLAGLESFTEFQELKSLIKPAVLTGNSLGYWTSGHKRADGVYWGETGIKVPTWSPGCWNDVHSAINDPYSTCLVLDSLSQLNYELMGCELTLAFICERQAVVY